MNNARLGFRAIRRAVADTLAAHAAVIDLVLARVGSLCPDELGVGRGPASTLYHRLPEDLSLDLALRSLHAAALPLGRAGLVPSTIDWLPLGMGVPRVRSAAEARLALARHEEAAAASGSQVLYWLKEVVVPLRRHADAVRDMLAQAASPTATPYP